MATGYLLIDHPNPNAPQGTYPRRGGSSLSGTCILHTSEGPWNAGVNSLSNFVRVRTDYGCYHRACDWEDIALYYPWDWECWQDSETNPWAVGIAAACRTTDWAIMPANIREGYYRNLGRMAADFITYMRTVEGILVPLRRITGAQARARVPGFCAHGDSGVSRSDPGADFDWTYFFKCTAEALGGASISPAADNITPAKPKDPLEEIMAFFKDKAEFSAWMQDQILWAVKNNPEIAAIVANAAADATLTRKVQRYTVEGGKSVPEKGKTTSLAHELGNRNQIDSRILGISVPPAATPKEKP